MNINQKEKIVGKLFQLNGMSRRKRKERKRKNFCGKFFLSHFYFIFVKNIYRVLKIIIQDFVI